MVDEKQDPNKRTPADIASRIGRPTPEAGKGPGATRIQGSQMKAEEDAERPGFRAEQAKKAAEAMAAAGAMAKHVWTSEDTYASLAFKHYGSNKEPYWRLIYEHNKQIIGKHPNDIRVGLEIEIPPLPDELKKK